MIRMTRWSVSIQSSLTPLYGTLLEQERNRIRFRCPDCGNDLNRSVNAAKNILVRGLAQPSLSAGESVIAGRASMQQSTAEVSAVRPENLVGA